MEAKEPHPIRTAGRPPSVSTGVACQDIIPDIPSTFLRDQNRDEVCSASRGVADQTETGCQTVDQTTEDTNQERIVGDRLAGDEVSQKAGQYHDTAGADSELRPQVLKADKSGNCVSKAG